jgi:hypothetical protein
MRRRAILAGLGVVLAEHTSGPPTSKVVVTVFGSENGSMNITALNGCAALDGSICASTWRLKPPYASGQPLALFRAVTSPLARVQRPVVDRFARSERQLFEPDGSLRTTTEPNPPPIRHRRPRA